MNDTLNTIQSASLHTSLMKKTIEKCREGIKAGQSPFAASIVTREGEIICTVHNQVRASGDVTAHAEIVAIRQACNVLNTINLMNHFLVSTCEPCPMCNAAIHQAKLDAVVYGAAIKDAQKVMCNELTPPTKSLFDQSGSHVKVFPYVMRDECNHLFNEWRTGPNPNPFK